MSTFQYYEFLALDGPISDEGLRYAEGCSSRAEVSRYRWTNSYHWGDFHGSQARLLQYYDAFFYFADWGSFRFCLAFPEGSLPLSAVESYLTEGGDEFGAALSCSDQSGRLVLCWDYQEDAVYWDDPVDISGMLGRLAGIREQILRGDYRALFIGWLAGFYWDEDYSDEELLPPIPAGMNVLSGELKSLADQLQLNQDALQAAVDFSRDSRMPESLPISDVVDGLSAEEMKQLLIRVGEGDERRVKAELIKKTVPQVVADSSERILCRTFSEKMLQVEKQRKEAQEKQAEMKRLQEERLRREHLELIFDQAEALWKQLDSMLVKKTASVYDSVARQLEELRDAYLQADESNAFAEHLAVFRGRYGRRPALMRRLDQL